MTEPNGKQEILLVPVNDRGRDSGSESSQTPTQGRPPSRKSSFAKLALATIPDEELPSNVRTEKQLLNLPSECLSGDKQRPLRHVDERGDVSHYALQPMFYSVIYILLVELFERFCFYGINYTQTSYLTGGYDDEDTWNAGMASVDASTYVSVSTAVAYTMPFVGSFFADSLLGDYWAMLFGALGLYLPGLLLIACSTVPYLLGDSFNTGALATGLLFLWPTGTGIVKSIVNVFGAKQYHPLLQSSLIESYYVNFYMCINIGALVGGVVIPITAQTNITLAYFIPVAVLGLGVVLFAIGTPRYVKSPPKGDVFSKNELYEEEPPKYGLRVIFMISSLIIPFNIAYSQMATTFIVQGTVMEKAFGFIDAASMNNADAISVLLFGYIIGGKFYPALASRGIKIPTSYKFAIGSGLGALAIGWALMLDYKIHVAYETTGQKISIMWQSIAYVLIGMGEIFAVSAAYEVAFTAAPPEKKVLASAMNLFCMGGIPNVLCIMLYHVCSIWFRNGRGTTAIHHIEDYAEAHVANYFWVLLGIALFGVIVNMSSSVRDFIASVEENATEMIKTPVFGKKERLDLRRKLPPTSVDEESVFLQVERHKNYLKYGSGPVLNKQGSMRAGPALSRSTRDLEQKHMKRSMIPKLYQSERTLPEVEPALSRHVLNQGDTEKSPLLKRASSQPSLGASSV